MRILAIDPGPEGSASILYDTEGQRPVRFEMVPNDHLVAQIERGEWHRAGAEHAAIEMVASYGMAVGREVFETVLWIGRFYERWLDYGAEPQLLYRRDVKLELCDDTRAKDANVRQALINRWGGKERAIGRKAEPGPLYGITGHVWQALGVAVTAAALLEKERTAA